MTTRRQLLDSRSHQVGFFHIPKTGGTSIRKTLRKAGYRWPWEQHETVRQAQARLDGFGDRMLLTVIRNPWARLVSSYVHVHRDAATPEGFAAFLETGAQAVYKRSQIAALRDERGNLPAGLQILLFERLAEQWPRIARSLEDVPEALPHLNPGRRVDWMHYYRDHATYRLARDLVAPDLSAFFWAERPPGYLQRLVGLA